MTKKSSDSCPEATRRRIRAVGVMLVVALAGTMFACAQGTPVPVSTMTPREGRDAVVQLVVESTKQLDVQGWWPRNGAAGPDNCWYGDDVEGASYSYSHWAPRGTDFRGDARKIADYWETLGMEVRVTATTHPTVYGEGGPVLRASFDTGAADDSYRVGAVAPCAPGLAPDLLIEDNAQRDAGAVLPGDEGVVPVPEPSWRTEPPWRPSAPPG